MKGRIPCTWWEMELRILCVFWWLQSWTKTTERRWLQFLFKPVLCLCENTPDMLWSEMVESIFLKVDWWYWTHKMAAPWGGFFETKNTEANEMFVHAYLRVKLHWLINIFDDFYLRCGILLCIRASSLFWWCCSSLQVYSGAYKHLSRCVRACVHFPASLESQGTSYRARGSSVV